jgi:hypothetical protein
MTRRNLLSAMLAPAALGEVRAAALPPLPESIAGQFAGVHAGRLIVAGGTSWSKPKWDGGEKRWTPAIYSLGSGETEWRKCGEQAEPLAYGGAASTSAGVVCIGGQGPAAASALAHLLLWDGSKVKQYRLADLPEPRMMLAASLSGGSVLAVGGQSAPDALDASSAVWRLDALDGNWNRACWRKAPPIPGPGRILPAMAACHRGFYVASGASLLADPPGRTRRQYLRDAFRFHGGSGWTALPALPAAVVAAPACCDASGRFLVIGGDDGALAGQVPEPGPRHPGFRRAILRLEAGVWREAGSVPVGLVTTAAVRWRDSIVIPGGEDRPGSRAARVFSIQGLTE